MKLFFYGLISFFFLLVSSCNATSLHVSLSVSPGLEKEWSSLISRFPLPDNIVAEKKTTTKNQCRITLQTSFLKSSTAYTVRTSGNTRIYQSIIHRQWYAPETPLWNSSSHNIHLVPLDTIHLPMKALPVHGFYPDNPHYSRVKSTAVTLSVPKNMLDSKEEKTLVSWIQTIANTSRNQLEKKPEIVWIAGVGDLMVQRGVENILIHSRNGLKTIFTNTLPVLKEQDLLLGNLEGSITRRSKKIPKSYNFKFNPEVLPILHEAGFDYLSQTNNHIYDFGRKGFIDSLRFLKGSSIATSGAGLTVHEAQQYWETTIKGLRIRVLSIGAYPRENNGFDGRKQASVTASRPGILFAGPAADRAVKEMVSKDTFDIIFIHGGREWHSKPVKEQKDLYQKYIDMGVDLIFGSHPHVLEGMEARKGKLIAYSLGNFIFPGMGGMQYAEDSVILSLGIVHGSIKYVIPYSVKIHNRTISLAKNNKSLIRYMELTKELNR